MGIKKRKKVKHSHKDMNNYEEISEKKTSKLGYIFLIIMVIIIIVVWEKVFSDLNMAVEEPVPPSYCLSNSIDDLKKLVYLECPYYDWYNPTDIKFELDVNFDKTRPKLKEISLLNESIRDDRISIEDIKSTINNLNDNYWLSLQEKIADENAIMDKSKIKTEIINFILQADSIENKISSNITKRDDIIFELTDSIASLKSDIDNAGEYYKIKEAWYKIKIFLLTLLFVVPFFVFSIYLYIRFKRKNSPYTIILTATTTAFSILFVQVIGVFIYDILPKERLEMIFKFFGELVFLRYVIYYWSVVLVIILFWGTVYYIQKKVFDPKSVAIRRIKDKKCPKCSFSLDTHHKFCPDCWFQLKEKCENCNNLKIRYLSHCPNCGMK